MKLFRKIFGLAVAAVLIGVALWLWHYKYQQFNPSSDGKTPDQKMTRWRSSAQPLMLAQATNDVPGLNRLVDFHLDTAGRSLNTWSGDVAADFVNHVGGIDRTNLHYVFTSIMGDLFCSPAKE